MSSILDALRELEDRPRPSTPGSNGRPEAPSAFNRLAETLGIASAGFLVGGVAFVLFVWILGRFGGAEVGSERIAQARFPGVEAPARVGAPAGRPAWLDTATAPRARLAPGQATSSSAETRVAVEGRDLPPRQAPPTPPGSDPPAAPGPLASATQSLTVESIDYDDDPARRRVTLRLGGRLVTFQQRQAAHGLEVQLIQPDGAYVRRGGEVFLVTPAR